MEKRINIVYFSGTGGTERAAKCFESEFNQLGYSVTLLSIKDAFKSFDCSNSILLLLYPVYAMNAPKIVHQWVESLGKANGAQAAVVSVSGGGEVSPNMACRLSIIKKLEKKGFKPTYENMLIMPTNFGTSMGQPLARLLLEALPKKVKAAASDIDSGTVRRTNPPVFDRLMTSIARLEHIGARSFGKHIKANDKCTGCGWCAENCPSSNITMQAGKPVCGSNCNFCLCCIYGRPFNALEAGMGKFAVIKEGYNLAALEKTQVPENADIAALATGNGWKGVREYLLNSD